MAQLNKSEFDSKASENAPKSTEIKEINTHLINTNNNLFANMFVLKSNKRKTFFYKCNYSIGFYASVFHPPKV